MSEAAVGENRRDENSERQHLQSGHARLMLNLLVNVSDEGEHSRKKVRTTEVKGERTGMVQCMGSS